ncbi:response regulator transcription factor [Gangjinia marincola]|uniref:Response regulator transcription factor n=1 Tax=Gangjinia marincola TaxID=578463 RepID=A0ABP3XSM9_9FLAO
MNSTATILLADDHPLLLSGLEDALSKLNYTIVASCEDGAKALHMIASLQPTIAILDVEMPYLSGIEVVQKCKEKNLPTKFILLTSHKEKGLILETKELAISGYVLKEEPLSVIHTCIQQVLRGGVYYSEIFDTVFNTEIAPELQRITYLTPSERTVVRLISQGHTSKSIADLLSLSVRTIDNHRANIISKLELPSKTDALTLWAKEHKILINKF